MPTSAFGVSQSFDSASFSHASACASSSALPTSAFGVSQSFDSASFSHASACASSSALPTSAFGVSQSFDSASFSQASACASSSAFPTSAFGVSQCYLANSSFVINLARYTFDSILLSRDTGLSHPTKTLPSSATGTGPPKNESFQVLLFLIK